MQLNFVVPILALRLTCLISNFDYSYNSIYSGSWTDCPWMWGPAGSQLYSFYFIFDFFFASLAIAWQWRLLFGPLCPLYCYVGSVCRHRLPQLVHCRLSAYFPNYYSDLAVHLQQDSFFFFLCQLSDCRYHRSEHPSDLLDLVADGSCCLVYWRPCPSALVAA